MRLPVACVLCLTLTAQAEPAPVVPATPTVATTAAPKTVEPPAKPAPDPALPLRARIDRDAIRSAITDLPVERDGFGRQLGADTFSAPTQEAFARDFARARLPNCLQSEGLRNQPTFFLSGVLALPFIAVAKVRGVCR